MAKIVITNGTIHSDDDFNLTSGSDANTRNNFRICKQKDSHTRLRSLSSFRIKAHDFLNTGNVEVCGNLTVHGTCTTLNTTVTATTTSTENNLTIVSTDAGAADAPDFKLYRNSASPANGDDVGKIKFTGNDTAGNETLYSGIFGEIITSGTGDECGRLVFETLCAGSNFRIATMEQSGLWICNNRNFYLAGAGSLRNYGAALNLSTGGGDYKIVFQPNSATKMCLDGGELTVCNKVYTPILRATACTFYGACGSSKLDSLNDSMRHTTQYGYIALGPGNSSWAHITTDRTCFYFNAPIAVDGGGVKSYDEDLVLSRAGNAVNRINIGTATTTSCNPTKLFSQQGHTLPASPGSACWVKFGAACIPQHGRKLRMKIVAGNGYGTNTAANTQETTLLFQTSNASEGASGSSVCAAVHSFIEGSTKSENEAPYCFIVHEVNSSFYEFFGKFNTYTGTGSYYTIDSGPGTCWIACNSFVDPDSCSGSCLLSIPNRGTVFCTSTSITCICGSAVMQGDICSNNGSRGFKLATDTAGSGSRSFLVLDSDGSDGIGAGSDYTLIVNDGSDTKIYNEGPEHIRLCGSSCVAFCKPIAVHCCARLHTIRNFTGTPYMCACSGCCLIGGIQFKDCQGCNRGWVYHDGTNNFGLLNCNGQWSLRIDGVQSSGTIHSCHQHCFLKNIGLAGGSASRMCIAGKRAMEGTSCILSLGEDFTSVCLRATCTITGGKLTVAGTCAVGVLNAIQDGGTSCYALNLVNSVNGGGASIMFNDNPAGTQRGYLRHFHSDSCDASGAGNSFHFDSTESTTAVRINQTTSPSGFYIGSSKMLNACVHGSVLCGTSCVKTPMIQAVGGKSCFSASAAAADDWECSALHIRERGLVSSNQSHCCYAPNINFHWAGRVSNSLWMDAVGQLNWGSYNANGCPEGNASQRFNTGILYGQTCVLGPVIFPTSCLQFDQTGTRSWKMYAASGNLVVASGDGGGILSSSIPISSSIVCGSTCVYSNCVYANYINADVSVTTNILVGGGSANSDYGAIQLNGGKGGYNGINACGTTFMAASDCSGGGIYNDHCNHWALYYGSNGASYLYQAGSARLRTLANGSRTCSSAGYLDICPTGSWGHFITDRSKFYVNKPWIVNTGCVGSYDEDLILHRGQSNGTAAERITITSGTTHICQYTNIAGKLAVNASGLTCCCALNCGKADFEVCTGGTATAAWTGGRFRIGADDVNWSTRIRQNGYFETYSSSLNLKVTTGNNNIAICPSGTGYTCVVGNLCVTGTVCADGVEGDTFSCAAVCTGTVCFNTGCVTGYDAVYDVYVSANPNCGGSSIYRDIVHMSVYVTTGWNGSAVTKYINHVNNFVRGSVHDSGGSTVTAVPKLLVGTTGCDCYAAACATCLQIQVAGGSNKNNTCVKIKRVF